MIAMLTPANLSRKMLRLASFLVVGLACVLAAPAVRAQDADSEVLTRLDRLEGTIRDLTGQVEQLQYRNQQLEQQVQRLQQQSPGGAPSASAPPPRPSAQYSAPSQYAPPPISPYSPNPQYSPPPAPRYSQPPAAQYAPPPTYPSGPAPAGDAAEDSDHHDAFNPAVDPNAPGAPRALGTSTVATEPPPPAPRQAGEPLTLSNGPSQAAAPSTPGQLPPPPRTDPNATGGRQAALSPPTVLPPGSTPKDQFDLGRGYFERKDYPLAAQTFAAFLRQYPSDHLTPEAQYWFGESLFQSRQYHNAAEAFLAVSTKYGTTARAPDAMLRLGQSLAALGQKEAACASLGEVLRKYPRASLGVKESVAREQKRVHC